MQLNLSSMAFLATDGLPSPAQTAEQYFFTIPKTSLEQGRFKQQRSTKSGLHRPLPLLIVNRCYQGAHALEQLAFHPIESFTNSYGAASIAVDGVDKTASRSLRPIKQPNRLLTIGAKLIGVLGLALPLSYFLSWQITHTKPVNAPALVAPMATFDKIVSAKTLKVATVSDSSTYFANDGFEHGFGFDVVRQYAQHLDAQVETVVFDNETAAIAALNAGQIDVALTNASTTAANDDSIINVGLSCGKDVLSAHGLNKHVAIQVRQGDSGLADDAKAFLCQPEVVATTANLANFYATTALDDSYSEQHFIDTMRETLPLYRASFEQNARQHGLDWQLLVAMGYQESHLQPDAVSPTGVQGIMMLTNATAEQMGVTDRVNPVQSIRGGAKYMRLMQRQFEQVPEADRVWFALAAYNMGPQAVKSIQAKLSAQGRDGNHWAEVYRYMAENQASNSRYTQCMQYVSHIRGYLEALKLNPLLGKKVA